MVLSSQKSSRSACELHIFFRNYFLSLLLDKVTTKVFKRLGATSGYSGEKFGNFWAN